MSQSKFLNRLAIALLCLSTLSACGFSLRGHAPLPKGIDTVHLQAGSAALRSHLRLALQANGALVAVEKKAADATLIIATESFDRRVLAVDPGTGKSREFELVYNLSFSFNAREGHKLLAPQQLRLRRDFVFDDDAVIGKSREEAVLVEEMRRDAAGQIMRRLSALARK